MVDSPCLCVDKRELHSVKCWLRLLVRPRTDHFCRNETRPLASHSPSRVAFCLVRQDNSLSRAQIPAVAKAEAPSTLGAPKSSTRRRDLLSNSDSNASHAGASRSVGLER